MVTQTYNRTLKALKLNPHEAVAVVPVSEFIDLTVPGRAFLPKAQNEPLVQRLVEDMGELHDLIQRDLTGQKLKNARGPLAEYIIRDWLSEPDDGPSPGVMGPFIVVTPTPLEFDKEKGELGIRAGQKFIIEDGESRGESFLWLLEQPDVEEELIERMLGKEITMVIHHGVPVEMAGKWFADINGRGVKVNANLIVSRDVTDPFGEIAKTVFPALNAPLEEKGRQVKATTPEIFTALQARLAVTALTLGPSAIGYGAGRIPDDDVDFEQLKAATKDWFGYVFKTLGVAAFKNKGKVLRSVPVLAAIGAVGRPYYDGNEKARREARQTIKDPTINWDAGDHWSGICGKVNPNTGKFAVGSAKEYGKAAFNALTDPNSYGYEKIRTKGA
ncbi:MAG: DNA sulfur modification protein DndB [Solirubrobacterales bacterium]